MLDDLGALREAAGKPGVGYPDTRQQQLPEERVGALKSFGARLVADATRARGVRPSWSRSETPDGTCPSGSRHLCQHRRVDQFTIDIGAVDAVDVDDLEVSVLTPKLGVVLADGDVVEDDVAVGLPAGGCDGPIQQEPGPGVGAALHDKQGRASRQPFDSPVFVAHVLFLIGWSWPPTHRGRC
jgi:hypothetical protein